MNLSPRIRNFCFTLLAMPWIFADLPVSIFGDHRITEGMKLRDKKVPDYSLSYSSNKRLIYLTGTLNIGIVTEFKKLLKTYPSAIGLVLESEGGNIYQARGLSNIIVNHELDTYSFSNCYSACTIAFIAGKKRYIGKQAELGFHSYRLESGFLKSLISIEHEQNKDLQIFAKQIPDRKFVQKIFQRESNEIWIPKHTELLKAGVIHEVLAD